MKGRMIYVPKKVLEVLGNIKDEHGVKQNREAFDLMTNYTEVGREVERISRFWQPINKKNRKGGMF